MVTSSRRNGGRSFRLRLEILEDRTLLSDCSVSLLTDSGDKGDLRYCILQATNGDTITFADGVAGTINLTRALPDLTHSISIEGPGADQLTVRRDTGGNYRIFTVDSGATVAISGLTITGGYVYANSGGGIYILYGGTLTVSNSTFFANSAEQVCDKSGCHGGYGGGIFNVGTLTVSNSTITSNSATNQGGGGIFNQGTLTVSNSTFAGNFASLEGGGIYNNAIMTVSNSTFAGNSAYSTAGGGIYDYTFRTHTRNTIIAGNTAPNSPDFYGSLGSLGHNLIGNTQGGSGFDPTDLLNVNPQLGPLQNNGGPTLTMALQCGSPAIDAGDNTNAPDWDQRREGFPRIVNGIIDIGAYEVQEGECDGSAPHGSRDKLNRFVGTALFHHEMPQSGFPNIPLSVDLKMNTLPDYVPATSTEPDTFSISRPVEKPPVHNSVFLDLNWDLPELKGIIF